MIRNAHLRAYLSPEQAKDLINVGFGERSESKRSLFLNTAKACEGTNAKIILGFTGDPILRKWQRYYLDIGVMSTWLLRGRTREWVVAHNIQMTEVLR